MQPTNLKSWRLRLLKVFKIRKLRFPISIPLKNLSSPRRKTQRVWRTKVSAPFLSQWTRQLQIKPNLNSVSMKASVRAAAGPKRLNRRLCSQPSSSRRGWAKRTKDRVIRRHSRTLTTLSKNWTRDWRSVQLPTAGTSLRWKTETKTSTQWRLNRGRSQRALKKQKKQRKQKGRLRWSERGSRKMILKSTILGLQTTRRRGRWAANEPKVRDVIYMKGRKSPRIERQVRHIDVNQQKTQQTH